MKKYKILENGVEITNVIGMGKGKTFRWDAGAEVNDELMGQEQTEKLLAEGKIEEIKE